MLILPFVRVLGFSGPWPGEARWRVGSRMARVRVALWGKEVYDSEILNQKREIPICLYKYTDMKSSNAVITYV